MKKINVGNSSVALDTVTGFEITSKENNGDILYICKVTYHIPYEKENTTHTYTFCVNPYVGETVN